MALVSTLDIGAGRGGELAEEVVVVAAATLRSVPLATPLAACNAVLRSFAAVAMAKKRAPNSASPKERNTGKRCKSVLASFIRRCEDKNMSQLC